MEDKDSSFRVIDRRGAARDEDETPKGAVQGKGFVKHETPPSSPTDIDFSTFVLSLATGALINMGLAPDPTTGKAAKNLELAKQNIDILGLIHEKTRGNLSEDEKQLIESLLTEIRIRFVDSSK